MKLPKPIYTVLEKNHRYTIVLPDRNIGPLKSVTGIIGIIDKPALVGWSAREASKFFHKEITRIGINNLTPSTIASIAAEAEKAYRVKSDKAMAIGTAAHDLFRQIAEGIEVSVPDGLAEIVREFKNWKQKTDIEIVAQELAVGSVKHSFGGRFDTIGYSKERGGFGIVDYKTSKNFYGNEYAYQVGGYAIAIEEQYGVCISWAEIARFSKDFPHTAEVRPIADLKAAKEGFLAALSLKDSSLLPIIGPASYESLYKESVKPENSKLSLPF